MTFSLLGHRRSRRRTLPVVDYSTPRAHEISDELLGATPLMVLLVESDDALAGQLRNALPKSEFEITRCSTGREALKCLLATNYDLILCDMVMPGFPGDMFYRAVERVRPSLCRRFLSLMTRGDTSPVHDFVRSIRGLVIWKGSEPHDIYQAVKAVSKMPAAQMS